MLIDEGFLYCCLGGVVGLQYAGQGLVELGKTFGKGQCCGRRNRAGRDMNEAVAFHLDYAPAGAAQSRIQADQPCRHPRPPLSPRALP